MLLRMPLWKLDILVSLFCKLHSRFFAPTGNYSKEKGTLDALRPRGAEQGIKAAVGRILLSSYFLPLERVLEPT